MAKIINLVCDYTYVLSLTNQGRKYCDDPNSVTSSNRPHSFQQLVGPDKIFFHPENRNSLQNVVLTHKTWYQTEDPPKSM